MPLYKKNQLSSRDFECKIDHKAVRANRSKITQEKSHTKL